MSRLYLFNPENDLALAQNTANYTPPPAAVRLRRAGATLPLWFAGDDDYVITDGVNARWLTEIQNRFGIKARLFSTYAEGMTPAPWGWSKAARRLFEYRGVPAYAMPDDEQLDRLRELSHRRTASLIAQALTGCSAPAAIECRTFDDVKTFTDRAGAAVVKLPWSSSGRGVIPVNPADIERQRQQIEGAIRRQGSVMVEPRYDKLLDFAVLFHIENGKCLYDGLSVFDTAGFSSYAGNVLASHDELHATICQALGGKELFDSVVSQLPAVLENIIGDAYSGPLGIDMMAVKASGYSLVPAVELNLRMTMGHLCHRFYRDHVAEGRRGRFSILPQISSGSIDCRAIDGRIISGNLDLAQPGSDFSFLISIE